MTTAPNITLPKQVFSSSRHQLISNCLLSFSLFLFVLIPLTQSAIADIKVVKAEGVSGRGLSPIQIAKRVQRSLEKVKPASISVNGGASGVIISLDGYVLTASHVALSPRIKGKQILIFLEDGRKLKAELIGVDRSSDIALLKINEESDPLPYVELSDKVPDDASCCFIYAHPGGYKKTRPAQLRLGRIRGCTQKDGQTLFMMSDVSVQPGDSGGPLFDVDGRLIGLCISAGPVGVNRFTSIDNFHKALGAMKEGKIWGDIKDSQLDTKPRDIDDALKKRVIAEFQKRIKDGYPPATDLVFRKAADGTRANEFGDITRNMGMDVPMMMDNGSISYGLDDPVLTAQLGKLPEGTVRQIPVLSKNKLVTFGIPVTNQHLLVKLSEIKKFPELHLPKSKGKLFSLTQCGTDPEWDLALLKLPDRINFKPVEWPEKVIEIKAGTGVMSSDTRGRLSWAVAADIRRPVNKPGRKGPMLDPTIISSFRAPYPSVISHGLPLYAKHAGTPVYTLEGELIGLHMGRISRTLGLIVDIHDIRKSVRKMLEAPKGKTYP
ncbi:MAG: S1-C subfamily serine protease [Cryomorphaceae bacterium]|jgi:S1-C subfamily serine protease